jgi:hypothetical protein
LKDPGAVSERFQCNFGVGHAVPVGLAAGRWRARFGHRRRQATCVRIIDPTGSVIRSRARKSTQRHTLPGPDGAGCRSKGAAASKVQTQRKRSGRRSVATRERRAKNVRVLRG